MRRAVYLLATALAVSPAFAQDVPASSLSIALNLPVDQPMILTISDQRTLPSGAIVIFTIAHHLRFTATNDGWDAVVVQQSVDCSGSANACRAYMAMMSSGNQAERHFAISRDGGVTMMPDEQGIGLGTTGAVGVNASMIVEQAEQSNPGVLRAGELHEALQFAGRRFDLENIWVGSPFRTVLWHLNSDGMVELAQEQLVDGTAAAGVARGTTSLVDPATGLMLASNAETRAWPVTDVPPISVRTWRLDRASMPAQ